MFSQLRAHREIERDSFQDTSSNSVITLFFGLHNAELFLDSILEFLRSQPSDFQLLIVDNSSSDSTWSKIREWPREVLKRATLVKNPINLGATGSLALNLDLIRTPWVSTIHQDDLYLKNHVQVQVEAIRSVTPACNCVVTDMGSLSSSGKIEAGRPRASWLLPDDSPESLFIANLRLHSVPFPAAAFRVEKLKANPIPWHSTAMPDTEWVLKTIGPNGVLHVPQITMYYRENPFSESHSLGVAESQLGNYMALNRVLNSESFYQLLASLADHDRNKFAEAVFEGLRFRITDEARLDLICLAAAEQMALAWGYSEASSLGLINRAYAKTGSDRIEGLVSRLMDFYGVARDTSIKIEQKSAFTHVPSGQSHRRWIRNATKIAILLLTRLPYRLRRRTFKAVIRVANKLQKLSPWKFDWR